MHKQLNKISIHNIIENPPASLSVSINILTVSTSNDVHRKYRLHIIN